jgi:hypothetical protein
VRGVEAFPDPDVDVVIRLVGREDALRFGETAARGFQLPEWCIPWFARLAGRDGWRAYLAYRAGEPVATGALHVQGTVGWLGFGTVVADHRRRGLHRVMIARRMCDAADLGCRWLQTETHLPHAGEPTPSLDSMVRSGSSVAYARHNYVLDPARRS